MYVFQLAVLGEIFAVSCVNWFRFDVHSVYHFRVPDKEASCKLSDNRVVLNCYDTWKCIFNKCKEFTGDLSVNTLVHGKLHCIDMELRHVSTVDSDREISDDNIGAATQYSARPELQAPASVSEQGQGRSDSGSRASRPPPRNTNPQEIESGFVTQADFLGSKTGQFERSFAPGSQSSPAAKLARHMQQQQRSSSAVTASPFAEDEERPLFSVDKNPYISPVITNNIGTGKTDFLAAGSPQTRGPSKEDTRNGHDHKSVTVTKFQK